VAAPRAGPAATANCASACSTPGIGVLYKPLEPLVMRQLLHRVVAARA
jgi:hypothetical protein